MKKQYNNYKFTPFAVLGVVSLVLGGSTCWLYGSPMLYNNIRYYSSKDEEKGILSTLNPSTLSMKVIYLQI